MEHLELEGLAVLFILLPGFLCARIIQSLCVRPKQTELDKIVESLLLYSFLTYVIFIMLHGGALPVGVLAQETEGITHYGIQLQPLPLVYLTLISLAWAFGISALVTNDLSGRIFRKLKLTQRTTRSSVWSDTFHEIGNVRIAQVELGDGRRVMGWLRHYSDEPKEASLFLEKAAWIDDDNNLVPIDGAGILITKELGINWIEFRSSEEPPAVLPDVTSKSSEEIVAGFLTVKSD